jgi:aryl-alcohol dehydrogenase-like predicted oxidoreductase
VPIEDTVGAMARLIEQGKVRYLGLCEAGQTQIARASRTSISACKPVLAVDQDIESK